MTITVVYDQPAQVAKALVAGLRRVLGGTFLGLGLVGAIGAAPTTFFVIGLALGADYDGLPAEPLLAWWARATMTAIGGVSMGWGLLRRGRRVVLFLRRFGDVEAATVVSHAAARSIGSSFRLVTLADVTIQPLGPGAGVSRSSQVGRAVGMGLNRFTTFVIQRLTPLTLSAALVTAGVAYMATGDAVAIADVAGSLLAGSIPFDTMGLDALGVFSIAATVAGVGLLALLVAFVSLLVRFPLAAVLLIGRSASRAVADAERTKLLSIRDRPDIARVVARIAQQSRRVIAPRLTVLRVATPVWKETVQRLAEVAEIVLIDISEPSDNLNWEVENVVRDFGSRCVFTCHESNVDALRAPTSTDPVVERLRALLGNSLVLAYRDDPSAARRFARALRWRMLRVAR